MIRNSLFVFLLLPGLAHAVICKTVAEDGSVSYADVPAAECPQEVKLPEYSRYAPRAVQQPAARGSSANGNVIRFERYQSAAIVQPEANGTVRNNEGRVPVAVALQPALQPGHLVMVYLDGNAVGGGFDGTAIELSGVDRGSHSLRAAVVDVAGRPLIETASVRFTMRQASLLEPERRPEPEPEPEPKPGDGKGGDDKPAPPKPPYAPGFDPTFDQGRAPSYAPTPGGSSSTPGRTNPAFAPKYTP